MSSSVPSIALEMQHFLNDFSIIFVGIDSHAYVVNLHRSIGEAFCIRLDFVMDGFALPNHSFHTCFDASLYGLLTVYFTTPSFSSVVYDRLKTGVALQESKQEWECGNICGVYIQLSEHNS